MKGRASLLRTQTLTLGLDNVSPSITKRSRRTTKAMMPAILPGDQNALNLSLLSINCPNRPSFTMAAIASARVIPLLLPRYLPRSWMILYDSSLLYPLFQSSLSSQNHRCDASVPYFASSGSATALLISSISSLEG